MFRFIRLQRSVLSMSRLPLRIEAQAQRGQATNVQKVQFRKPRMRPRSMIISILAFYVGFAVYSKIVLEPLEHAATEALKSIPEEELDDEAEEKPLFIPFPGTTKPKKVQPYRGSDPEWQEFIKFSKDQELAKRVRNELAGYVKSVAEKHPVITMRCGKGMQLRRYWLDVDFPAHPPPEFERSGIEISDDYITWTTNPVDSLTVFRIRNAMWPSALVQSFWSFTKVMVVDDLKRLASVFGIRPSTPVPPLEQILARHQQLFRGPPPTKDGPPQPFGDATRAITGTQDLVKPATTGREASDSGEESTDILAAIRNHYSRSIAAFTQKLHQTWKPVRNYPPRGSIIVSGLVELDAPKSWLVFDVKAAWDPQTRTFDPRSMHIQLRRMQPKKQGPSGGD